MDIQEHIMSLDERECLCSPGSRLNILYPCSKMYQYRETHPRGSSFGGCNTVIDWQILGCLPDSFNTVLCRTTGFLDNRQHLLQYFCLLLDTLLMFEKNNAVVVFYRQKVQTIPVKMCRPSGELCSLGCLANDS